MSNGQQIEEFERLVTERQDWLFRFAYMRIGRREDAEDVVQEALMALFNKMRKDKGIGNIDAYIIRSISNACIDYHRRKRHKVVGIEEIEDMTEGDGDRQIHEEFCAHKPYAGRFARGTGGDGTPEMLLRTDVQADSRVEGDSRANSEIAIQICYIKHSKTIEKGEQ